MSLKESRHDALQKGDPKTFEDLVGPKIALSIEEVFNRSLYHNQANYVLSHVATISVLDRTSLGQRFRCQYVGIIQPFIDRTPQVSERIVNSINFQQTASLRGDIGPSRLND